MEFDLAERDEAPEILRLFAAGFPADRQSWIPLGCPGALAFVEDTIACQELGGENCWLVARDGGVAGCAEVRRSPARLFLNHVLVRSDLQGQGLGRRLLREGFRLLRRDETKEVSLDVFEDNTRALSWYRRLGFEPVSATRWEAGMWSADSGADGTWSCSGLPQADCVHARYGFSMFELTTPRGQFQVGRLGSALFRVADEQLLKDPDAAVALRTLGKGRKVLLLRRSAMSDCSTEPGVLARGLRMSAQLDVVMERLGRK